MIDDLDFTGRTALVTGSSRGIGAGVIAALGQRGARCIVNYVADTNGQNEADAHAVAAKLQDSLIIQCDIGDPPQVAAMSEQIRSTFGGIDLLVNNAGILRDRSIKNMTIDDWNAVLQVNLTGTFLVTQKMGELIRAGGRIVNLASVAGTLGFFGQSNYAASKAGVIALTKVSARELAKRNITVNAIAPGFIDTEMTKGMPEDVSRKYLEQIPLARVGTIDDIVGAALFLCSRHAQYITGQVIHVDGGFYMGTA